jgi:hypothetical protein
MKLYEKMAPQLQDIGEKIKGAKRVLPGEPLSAGWGQFLDAEGHKEQVGPYGTCSAILFDQILNLGAPVDDDVANLVERFWNDPDENQKLRNQNVRLAYLILSLARVDHPKLVKVRGEAVELLVERQLSDGAWGDWATAGTKGPPRQETTAWIILALVRANVATDAVDRAQQYLLRFVGPDQDSHSSISDFAAASLLSTLPSGKAPSKLKYRVKTALRLFEKGQAERISFFDYFENPGGNEPPSLKRDYLCYPAILPFALMTYGLTAQAKFSGQYAAASARILLAQNLQEMVGGAQYYELPGAARAASVDQAAIAVAFESLRDSEFFFDHWLSLLRPMVSWVKESLLTRVLLPLLLAILALFAIQDPDQLLLLVPNAPWIDRTSIQTAITTYENSIRLIAGVYLFFANSTPGRVWGYIRDRWLR